MKMLSLSLVAGAVLLAAPHAHSAPKVAAGKARGPAGARLKQLGEKLDLTPEQRQKIRAILARHSTELRELRAKGRDKLTDADRTKLREVQREQMKEIAAVLTPEQKQKMQQMRKQRSNSGEA